jgi:CheY-like chemotaxis protein
VVYPQKEFQGRIFQKFSQADGTDARQKGGTGLGLAISKELIERMQGLVGFETEPGRTCFYFDLPVLKAETATQSITEDETPAAPCVLMVEDNHDVATVLAAMLDRHGYDVHIACDGETALSQLAQREFDVMTLDLLLPDHNGVALIRRVRGNPETTALPIIVVSAYTEGGKMAIDGDFPDVEWLEKPTDETRLINAVRRATAPRDAKVLTDQQEL